ncbi:unnamed protein product [Hanseniaspora opuntiae]
MDIYKSSPASPFNEKMKILMNRIFGGYEPADTTELQPLLSNTTKTTLQKENIIVKRIKEMLIVCAVVIIGILSWYITYISKPDHHKVPLDDRVSFNITAQFFGYISAVFYLASRLPQIFLNIKNKSTDGISFLFFLLACLGNITFVLSVLSISLDKKYILVNLSWLIGSSGTLFMDFLILCQFFYYGEKKEELSDEVEV